MDLGEASFQVDNISKLWGDWFLGKVYRACAKKFELDSWRMNVEEKMKDLSEIYEVAEAELEARRLLILEFLVVLLFIVDLFFFQAEDGIRDLTVTGVQTCALPI